MTTKPPAATPAPAVPVGPSNELRLEYWTALAAGLPTVLRGLRCNAPKPSGCDIPVGLAGVTLYARSTLKENVPRVGVSLRGTQAYARHQTLLEHQHEIDREFAKDKLEWLAPEGQQERDLRRVISDFDFSDRASWPRQHAAIIELLAKLNRAVVQRLSAS